MQEQNRYTSGAYLDKNPDWHSSDAEWKASEVDKMMHRNNLEPGSVADIGCGSGKVLAVLSDFHQSIRELRGFDISPQAIAIARQAESEKLKFSEEDFTTAVHGIFDLVLVLDVIEHLEDYFSFLRKIRTRGRHFIFHIPLDLSCRTVLKPHILLQQRADVGHLHYFSKEHAWWLLEESGFTIKDWFYTLPEIDRRSPVGFKNWLKKKLRKISFSISKNLSAKLWGGYSVMILAQQHE